MHDRVSVCLYISAGIMNVRRRANKRGERNIRKGKDGALALLEHEE